MENCSRPRPTGLLYCMVCARVAFGTVGEGLVFKSPFQCKNYQCSRTGIAIESDNLHCYLSYIRDTQTQRVTYHHFQAHQTFNGMAIDGAFYFDEPAPRRNTGRQRSYVAFEGLVRQTRRDLGYEKGNVARIFRFDKSLISAHSAFDEMPNPEIGRDKSERDLSAKNPSASLIESTTTSFASLHPNPYAVDIKKKLEFERNGHAALSKLFLSSYVQRLAHVVQEICQRQKLEAYKQKLEILMPDHANNLQSSEHAQRLLDEAAFKIPFLQYFNLHRICQDICDLALSKYLGQVAADLLNVDAVRLYQDSVFWKRSGDGPTLWHADLNMVPLDTNNFLTFFIPLRNIAAGKYSPSLRYASGSHRDFAVAYWYDTRGNRDFDLSRRYIERDHGSLAIGDATVHHGWTLHSSNGIPAASKGRVALSITYVEANARVLPRPQQNLIDKEDYRSYASWLKQSKPGKPIKHELLPVVYDRKQSQDAKTT